jgi:hypothetical protein
MSMNLHCNQVELWQTPTYVTHMCLMNKDGIAADATGDEAVRALRCYLEWARTLLPYSVAKTAEHQKANEDFHATFKKHSAEVTAVFGKEGLEVYLL